MSDETTSVPTPPLYIGCKLIRALPQTKDGVEGYAVWYPDGYKSWSPKATFEEAYRPVTEIELAWVKWAGFKDPVKFEPADEESRQLIGAMVDVSKLGPNESPGSLIEATVAESKTHAIAEEVELGSIICPICKRQFMSKERLDAHACPAMGWP